mmetsp:Transcript_62055/g.174984  ORF Transcript_62055/g.174984 Transcript_62055/m.174984 type:complete len:267 (+) Transcript_62055:860-1660(+)
MSPAWRTRWVAPCHRTSSAHRADWNAWMSSIRPWVLGFYATASPHVRPLFHSRSRHRRHSGASSRGPCTCGPCALATPTLAGQHGLTVSRGSSTAGSAWPSTRQSTCTSAASNATTSRRCSGQAATHLRSDSRLDLTSPEMSQRMGTASASSSPAHGPSPPSSRGSGRGRPRPWPRADSAWRGSWRWPRSMKHARRTAWSRATSAARCCRCARSRTVPSRKQRSAELAPTCRSSTSKRTSPSTRGCDRWTSGGHAPCAASRCGPMT